MTIEITSTDGMHQFQININNPRQVLVRKNRRSAHWWALSTHESSEEAIAALLAAKDRTEGTVLVTIDVVPFDIEQLTRTIHVLMAPLDDIADADSVVPGLVADALRGEKGDGDK